ncbi:MAG: hypothetical protein ACXVZV_12730 [Terriglobales bacterium]
MPIMQKGIAALSDHLPKVISPKTHAIADYATLGGLVLMGVLFWKRRRRAAIGAIACAAAEAANTLLTDFPGGVTDAIDFHTHGRIDYALAAATSALPNFLGFGDEPEAKFFRMVGINVTTIAAMTDFDAQPRHRSVKTRRIA